MARSTLLVSANGLRDILPFIIASARIIGSKRTEADRGMVALTVEGDAIPDVPTVKCTVSKKVKLGRVTLTMAYEAAD